MNHVVCPYWVGHLLASPLRRLLHNPRAILAPYVVEGAAVLDVGCAMGFFSLPLAAMVGSGGKVVCVELQQRMLDVLRRRAERAGIASQIELRACRDDSLALDGLDAEVDFALAFYVIHEVPDEARCLAEIHRAMRPGAKFLMVEPAGHVWKSSFEATIAAAEQTGLKVVDEPKIRWSHAALFERTDGGA